MMLALEERWRPVPGMPYEASDRGRIRRSEPGPGTYAGRVLTLRPCQTRTTAYLKVRLCVDGEPKMAWAHRLVCMAWHGPPPFDGAEVDHGLGGTFDNTPPNLSWVSHTTNQMRAWERRRAAAPVR